MQVHVGSCDLLYNPTLDAAGLEKGVLDPKHEQMVLGVSIVRQ